MAPLIPTNLCEKSSVDYRERQQAFIGKAWPDYELRGLIAREIASGRVILPLWHGVTRDDVLRFGTSRKHFEDTSEASKYRSALLAVALLLQRPICVYRLGRFDRVVLAYRIFGRARVDEALDRVVKALIDWGYSPPSRASLRMTLCEVFLTIQRRVWKTFRSTRSRVFGMPPLHINVCAVMSCDSRAPWPDSV
jgi:hypothetical protein